MASHPTYGERTPLLIGVEGLGSPGNIRRTEVSEASEIVEEGGLHVHGNGIQVPCIRYAHGHDDISKTSKSTTQAKRKLIAACVICLVFLVGEFVGGILANSLAVVTDAAHLLSDFASFLISLLAIWFATRPSTSKLSYGWHRAEVMGALLSVLIIWVLTGVLVYEAVGRVISGEHKVNADIMLIVAACGVGVNVLMGFVLGHSHSHGHSHKHSVSEERRRTISMSPSVKEQSTDENVNVRAAFVHVIGDLFQSVGVLIAAYVIKFKPDYSIADPICTFVFSVIVLITTVTVLRDTLIVLMEGTPHGVDLDEMKEKLLDIRGVKAIHDLHVWSLTVGTTALSAHIDVEHEHEAQRVLSEATTLVACVYHIQHSTIQIEKYKESASENNHTSHLH